MCKWCELIIGVVILVFAFWQVTYSQWIIAIAALALIAHSFMNCKYCGCKCESEEKVTKKKRR